MMMIFVLLVLIGSCKFVHAVSLQSSARADEQMEKSFREWLARQENHDALTDIR